MTPPTRTPILDRTKLDPIVDPIVHAHGGEVFDIEFKSEAQGWSLRVFVEKLGSAEKQLTTLQAAVDLELCSNIARELSPALDVHDFIPHRYNLEVGSPGVERQLKRLADFTRFVGNKAKLKLHAAVSGQKVLVGMLEKTEGDTITLVDGRRAYDVSFDNVASAHLIFEYAPAPKPTGKLMGKSAGNPAGNSASQKHAASKTSAEHPAASNHSLSESKNTSPRSPNSVQDAQGSTEHSSDE